MKLGWFIESGVYDDNALHEPNDVESDSVIDDAGNHGGRDDSEVGDGATDVAGAGHVNGVVDDCVSHEGLCTDYDVVDYGGNDGSDVFFDAVVARGEEIGGIVAAVMT